MGYQVYSFAELKNKKIKPSEKILGRKALLLSSLAQHKEFAKYIPPFSIITSDLYYDFINFIQTQEPSSSPETIVKSYNLQAKIKSYIPKILKGLSTHNVRLVVRPSIGCTKAPNLHFSSLLPTLINITSEKDLITSIENILHNIASETFALYLRSNNLSYLDVSVGIIIQKLAVPEVAGIAYPYNPVTHNLEELTIEAVYGLGDVIAKGEIIPDIYVVNAKTKIIKEKRISPQTWMRLPNNNTVHNLEQTEKIQISQLMQYSQKLEDSLIEKVAKLVQTLNTDPKNIWLLEWGVVGTNVYIYQLKHLGIKQQTKESPKTDKTSNITKNHNNITEYIPPILQGLPLSSGVATGEVVILTDPTPEKLQKLAKRRKGFILATKNLNANIIMKLKDSKCSGIIFDTVVPNNEISLLLQDLGIPAIGATYYATSILKPGKIVKIDANTGSIYKIATISESQPSGKSSKKVKKVISVQKQQEKDIKSKTNNNKQPAKEFMDSNVLKILTKKEEHIYSSHDDSWILYNTPNLNKQNISEYFKKHSSKHLIVVPLVKNTNVKNLIKNYIPASSGIEGIPTFVITSFQELITATKLTEVLDKIALIINIKNLYEIYNGQREDPLSDASFLTFLEQMLLRYRESTQIYLGALLAESKVSTLTRDQISRLEGLGFLFAVCANTL